MSVSARPLTLAEISEAIPGSRGAKRLSPATLTRWIISGSTARNGQRIRLTATRAGSRWLVYQTDLDSFFAALAADPTSPPVPTPRSESKARKSSQAAGRKLAAMGA